MQDAVTPQPKIDPNHQAITSIHKATGLRVDSYLEAIAVAQVLFAGSAFAAVALLLDTFFVNQLHRPGLVSIVAWVRFLLGLIISLLLIPSFGVRGAAASVALVQIIGAAVYLYLYVRVTKSGLKDLLYIRAHDIAFG